MELWLPLHCKCYEDEGDKENTGNRIQKIDEYSKIVGKILQIYFCNCISNKLMIYPLPGES